MTEDDRIAGLRIHRRRFGHGARPALILHCGQGTGGMWRRAMAPLADRLKAVAPDFPGHGRSDPWPPGRDVHDVAMDVASGCLVSGAHVIGHSFGATVALRLALAHPHRVTRLSLVEPVLFAAADGSDEAAAQATADSAFDEAIARGDRPGAARAFNRQWGAGQRWDSLKPETRDRMVASLDFIRASEPALKRDIHGILAAGGLEALTIPVTLIRGVDTQPVIAAIHRVLAGRLPNAGDRVIAGAGHMAPVTHPEAVAEAIAA